MPRREDATNLRHPYVAGAAIVVALTRWSQDLSYQIGDETRRVKGLTIRDLKDALDEHVTPNGVRWTLPGLRRACTRLVQARICRRVTTTGPNGLYAIYYLPGD